jgi:hypothetical protein
VRKVIFLEIDRSGYFLQLLLLLLLSVFDTRTCLLLLAACLLAAVRRRLELRSPLLLCLRDSSACIASTYCASKGRREYSGALCSQQ